MRTDSQDLLARLCETSRRVANLSNQASTDNPHLKLAFSAVVFYNRHIDVYLLRCIGVVMEDDAVRWNIKVSKETDLTLRTYLGAQGAKKGDLSKFIEEAVRWHVFHRTVQDIRDRNADTDPDELQRMIDEAVSEVRAERYAKGKADKA